MVVSFSTLFIGTANDMGVFIFSVWYAVYKETNMDIFEKIHLTKLKHKELKDIVLIITETYVESGGLRIIIGDVLNKKIKVSDNWYYPYVLSDPERRELQRITFKVMYKGGKIVSSANVSETVKLTTHSKVINVEKGMVLSKRKLKVWEVIILIITYPLRFGF